MSARALVPFLVAVTVAGCGAATGQESASEIERLEAGKWDALRNGNWMTMESLYDDAFYSLVYGPAGTLQESDKASTFSVEGQPPAAEFRLGGMRVTWAGRDAAVLTYTVTGPMGYPVTPMRTRVSSVWARKNGQWKTVFFQMSPEG